ncbi:hypothetical protein [Mycolicibacterium goodii]|uniref:hypothetical protein n=1 Tax=Mycolicibacterium goodii TaxID=134601 RepID=UPI001BDC760B|nr:hypothetical protein [Mycolicibacterium goodii]MBU8833597.1 hypothetical protein [Mycolicibacterium goodii]
MTEALQLWKRYPKQIEAGLRAEYPGAHIRQWLTGEMSSREFMVLIEGLSGDSWFKASLRADMQRSKAASDREELQAVRAQIDGMLTGRIRSEVPLEIAVEKRKPTTQREAVTGG